MPLSTGVIFSRCGWSWGCVEWAKWCEHTARIRGWKMECGVCANETDWGGNITKENRWITIAAKESRQSYPGYQICSEHNTHKPQQYLPPICWQLRDLKHSYDLLWLLSHCTMSLLLAWDQFSRLVLNFWWILISFLCSCSCHMLLHLTWPQSLRWELEESALKKHVMDSWGLVRRPLGCMVL